MNFLDEDKSWELFCGKTFDEEDCPVELEEIGKKIVKRCKGLPLSIVVIAGHLGKSPRGIEYWEKVAKYMNPISSIGEEELCLEILSLSYQHLPPYLKPCFLYFGIFREDELIFASKLIQFWIAEGFLKPKKGSSLEEVGEYYLRDLVDRNLILVDESSWNAKVVGSCKVHDTVREMCLKVCNKEKFLCVVQDSIQATSCSARRLVIMDGEKLNSDMIGAKQSARLIRSLVNRGEDTSLLNELLADCNLLRLMVHDTDTYQLTDSTSLRLAHFQQVNLRALDFHQHGRHVGESAYSILSSLSACWNLQTLFVDSSFRKITLPSEIWEMQQLRNLQVRSVCLPDPFLDMVSTQQEYNVLQNLHTLEGVENLRLTEEVCERMPNLEDLSVPYDFFCDCYCFHNFGLFNKLKSLQIRLDNDSKWCDIVLSLTFPTSLEELYLHNSHLGWEDLTRMISSLPHLRFLSVFSVRGSEWNLDDEEFSCLTDLTITNCKKLMYWNANSSHFPVLETLTLYDIPKLSEIPLDIGEIPTLRHIRLSNCGVPAAVSAVTMVMEQESNGNYDLQLEVSFWSFIQEEFERFQEILREECLSTSSLHLYYNDNKIKTT